MINEKVRRMELSGIRKMFEMATEDTINLGLGQPDFNPPEDVVDHYRKAMLDGYNGYGSSYGLPALREEIARHQSKYRSDITSDNVMVNVGATQALRIVMESTVCRGDEVLYPEPGFVLYSPQTRIAGAKPVPYPVLQRDDFIPSVDKLEELRTPDTKAIIVNSPGNPTGGVITKKAVKEITEWAVDNDILIISDEVYEMMVYDGDHISFLGDHDNVIAINSFSKTFAMTGWRIGFMVTRSDWIKEIGKLHYYTVACPPTPPQHAILYALKERIDFVEEMTRTFKKRRDVIVSRLNDINGFDCLTPKGAFYVFPTIDLNISSDKFAFMLLEKGVLATPGNAFGSVGEGHIRFSYANSTKNIHRAMDILEDTVEEIL